MPPENPEIGSPSSWIARAMSNLIRARQPKPEGVFWEDVCFDAQQAVEKALKALLLHRNIRFRFVHHIGELMDALSQNGEQIPENVLSSVELTEFAVEARYPGPFEPVTEEEAKDAIETAQAVIEWVESKL